MKSFIERALEKENSERIERRRIDASTIGYSQIAQSRKCFFEVKILGVNDGMYEFEKLDYTCPFTTGTDNRFYMRTDLLCFRRAEIDLSGVLGEPLAITAGFNYEGLSQIANGPFFVEFEISNDRTISRLLVIRCVRWQKGGKTIVCKNLRG